MGLFLFLRFAERGGIDHGRFSFVVLLWMSPKAHLSIGIGLNLMLWGKRMIAFVRFLVILGTTFAIFSGGVCGVLSFDFLFAIVDISPSLFRCALKMRRDSIILGRGVYNFLSSLSLMSGRLIHVSVPFWLCCRLGLHPLFRSVLIVRYRVR